MKTKLGLLIFGMLLSALAGCTKENILFKSHLDSIAGHKYYAHEIIPSDYQCIYGKWKLIKISGGFSGKGYDPDFDYLEIKSIGIYGLTRNDLLFESGKIIVGAVNNSQANFLQVKFIPDFQTGINPYFYPPEKQVRIDRADTLDLISPCCDLYNYHFKRVK